MQIFDTAIEGVKAVKFVPFSDERGSFSRWFCERDLEPIIGNRKIVQINHSRTLEVGALRGLHFQKSPHSEMKCVRCTKGKVWDVTVDLRKNSPTFLKWHAEELSSENTKMMVIPEGCAHGFQTLEADSELLYLHTAFFTPEAEGGILYSDPALNIAWPLKVIDVSKRDRNHPPITDDFSEFD